MNDYGGYPTEIFSKVPDPLFKCPTCMMVLREPVQCKNGHMFCTSCIAQSLALKSECPACRCHLTKGHLSSSLAMKELISKLKVKCGTNPSCKWTGILSQRDGHKSKECEFETIACPFFSNGCGTVCTGRVVRKDLPGHLADVSNMAGAIQGLLTRVETQGTEIAQMRATLIRLPPPMSNSSTTAISDYEAHHRPFYRAMPMRSSSNPPTSSTRPSAMVTSRTVFSPPTVGHRPASPPVHSRAHVRPRVEWPSDPFDSTFPTLYFDVPRSPQWRREGENDA